MLPPLLLPWETTSSQHFSSMRFWAVRGQRFPKSRFQNILLALQGEAHWGPTVFSCITPDGSMVLLYMVCHGSHQYTPFMLAFFYQHHGSVMGNANHILLAEFTFHPQVQTGEVCVLFRNNHFCTVPRHWSGQDGWRFMGI